MSHIPPGISRVTECSKLLAVMLVCLYSSVLVLVCWSECILTGYMSKGLGPGSQSAVLVLLVGVYLDWLNIPQSRVLNTHIAALLGAL